MGSPLSSRTNSKNRSTTFLFNMTNRLEVGLATPCAFNTLVIPTAVVRLVPFTALCHRGHDHPHAIVYVWTVAQGGIGGYDSLFDPIPDCCAASPDIEALPVVEYTFQVACGCPSTGRFLRG